ncbi:MAG: hypothetical protein KAY37_01035 [Phycisphaerae bacterium]|nr:hypothetical protein [Phycisphaerae bacterium]
MIALDPQATVEFCLDAWPGVPDQRPAFIAHYLTCRQNIEYDKLLDRASELKPAEGLPVLLEAIGLGLVGWRNVCDRSGRPLEFEVGLLGDLLTWHELWELAGRVLSETSLAESDRKKSLSPSPPETGPTEPADSTADSTD